jgi:hypothetical protein
MPLAYRLDGDGSGRSLATLLGKTAAVSIFLALRRGHKLAGLLLVVSEGLRDRDPMERAVTEPDATAVVDTPVRALEGVNEPLPLSLVLIPSWLPNHQRPPPDNLDTS